MVNNKLSKRLEDVAKFVKKGARVVDVGSDHAYLTIHLVENNIIDFAVAGEVAKGPLSRSEENIKLHNLVTKIHPRLGDGLSVITKEDNIDTAVIAGMGGILITDILNRFYENSEFELQNLILQPNIGEALVREWLVNHNYEITGEDILNDDNHVYEIISAEKRIKKQNYTRSDILLGPSLRKEMNETFILKWTKKLNKYKTTLENIKKAKEPNDQKIKQLSEDIKILEEVLND